MTTRTEQILALLPCQQAGKSCSNEQGTAGDENTVIFTRALNYNAVGKTEAEELEVDGWLAFSRSEDEIQSSLPYLNEALSNRTFFVGGYFTIADAAVFHRLHTSCAVSRLASFPHVQRWAEHVQRVASPGVLSAQSCSLPILPIFPHLLPAPAAQSSTAPDAVSSESKPSPVAEVSKVESKAETTDGELDPSKLDIRVGLVVKCWDHADSDKLLCEEIDIGEGSTRSIASGIRAFYTAEQLQGRKVLVLANLKDRNIAGFKSQGMVLCASNSDKSSVVLLDVPACAEVGDRVCFEGWTGEPATAAQVAKKKILEALLPLLRTDGSGVARHGGSTFLIRGSAVSASLPNAQIS